MTEKERGEQWEKQVESWCAGRVKMWQKPKKGDYDFSGWMARANTELLQAGCVYEYARESRRWRCWLLLINNPETPKFTAESWVKAVRRGLRGAKRWLIGFVDELADNTSFEDLLRTKTDEVKQSLAKHPIHLPKLKAIDLAWPKLGDAGPPPWPWQPWVWSRSGTIDIDQPPPKIFNRPSCDTDGSDKIAVVIRWRDYSNAQIVREMKNFAKDHRHPSEPEPKQGQKPRETIVATLKALSAMRISKLHTGNKWERLELVAKVCRYRGCVREAEDYKARCKTAHGDQPMSQAAKTEMSDARSRALSFFQSLFSNEQPSNY